MNRRARVFFVTLFISFSIAPALFAQRTQGSISGTVFDASGAVVPGAKVTVTEEATSAARTVASDAEGRYTFDLLSVGSYTVSAELQGFAKFEQKGVFLDANQKLKLDVTLRPGAVTQTISVTEAPPLISTQTGEVGHVVSAEQTTELPAVSRNFQILNYLKPGVSSNEQIGGLTGLGVGLATNTGVSVNGTRASQLNWMVDGAVNMDMGSNENVLVFPGLDNIQEVKIAENSYGAEYGRNVGAAINIVTKSGTQTFHGGVWEFFRNDALNARNFFTPGKAKLRWNNFGGNVGGPVFWPGKYNSDRTKTFFFFSDDYRVARFGNIKQGEVPDAAMRSGDFSELLNLNNTFFPGQTVVLSDPTGRNCVVNNVIQALGSDSQPCLDSAALGLEKLIALPNRPGQSPNFVTALANKMFYQEQIFRVDHRISEKMQLMVRFIQDETVMGAPSIWDPDVFNFVGNDMRQPSKMASIQLTNSLSPSSVNTFQINYTNNTITQDPHEFVKGIADRSDLGITKVFPIDPKEGGNFFPFTGFQNFAGPNFGLPWGNRENLYEYRDDYSKVYGAHTIRAGGRFFKGQKNEPPGGNNVQGSFFFTNGGTNTTGLDYANFLLGYAFEYQEKSKLGKDYARWTDIEWYVADNWKIRPNLTVDYGIRHQIFLNPTEHRNQLSLFDPRRFDPAKSPVVNPDGTLTIGPNYDPLNGLIIAGDPKLPLGLTQNHYDTFGPRISFSWDPFNTAKTAIRGGFGTYYDRNRVTIYTNAGQNPPFLTNLTVFNTRLDNPGGTAATLFPPSLVSLDLTQVPSKVFNWSLGVQRLLPGAFTLDVSYIATRGIHLERNRDWNEPPPSAAPVSPDFRRPYLGYSGIIVNEKSASSTYHSLQVNVNRRFQRGIAVEASYTWSRALTDTSASFELAQNSYDLRPEWSPSSFDRTHMFVFNYIWDVPFGKSLTGIAKTFLGGWEVSGITSFQTGPPATAVLGSDVGGIGFTNPGGGGNTPLPGQGQRGDAVQGQDPNTGPKTAEQWFNANAFSLPAAGTLGNVGKNNIRLPGINNWDFSMIKNFAMRWYGGRFLGETAKWQFRAEMYNIFNHTQFKDLNTTFGAPGFGSAQDARDPRIIQFGLKLSW